MAILGSAIFPWHSIALAYAPLPQPVQRPSNSFNSCEKNMNCGGSILSLKFKNLKISS